MRGSNILSLLGMEIAHAGFMGHSRGNHVVGSLGACKFLTLFNVFCKHFLSQGQMFMKLAEMCRQDEEHRSAVSRQYLTKLHSGKSLRINGNNFAEIFLHTKEVKTVRRICPYPPSLEIVYPSL